VRIELVIRGYLAGHAAREYKAGKRILCGVALPEGLKENDKLPVNIITPSTKAVEGHDEDISREDILKRNIVSEEIYVQMEKYTHRIFERGQQMANERGLILVDTKYEFGISDGKVMLIDEIHTPDSSRYFYLEGYEERQAKGEPQKQLSKEFVREWLMANGFQGKDGQVMPFMPDEFVETITDRYIQLYEIVTGNKFVRDNTTDIQQEIQSSVLSYLAAH
jgi:phosphoribosylaminoimidazole-succinocarboxamide synthase